MNLNIKEVYNEFIYFNIIRNILYNYVRIVFIHDVNILYNDNKVICICIILIFIMLILNDKLCFNL